MKIGIVGAGYVGLVTGVGLTRFGHTVIVADIDHTKVNMINQGKPPFFEAGIDTVLPNLLTQKRLEATRDVAEMVKKSELVFLCVGTNCTGDGHIDLTTLRNAATDIGTALIGRKDYPIIVVKSTVIPGTTEEVVIPILEEKSGYKEGLHRLLYKLIVTTVAVGFIRTSLVIAWGHEGIPDFYSLGEPYFR